MSQAFPQLERGETPGMFRKSDVLRLPRRALRCMLQIAVSVAGARRIAGCRAARE
jgi:hypothetical protein